MTITLGSSTLVAGQARNSTGSPIGPRDLKIRDTPGVAVREYVGADRVSPEHVRCDHGVIEFGATRTFASVDAALAWATGTGSGQFFGEASEGELKFDNSRVFGAKSAVTSRSLAVVGCTVAVNYVIEG